MRQKLRGIFLVRLALLLLVTIVSVGISGYTLSSAHAESPSTTSAKDSPISSVTRAVQEPDTSIMVFDPESDTGSGSIDVPGAAGGYFPIKISLSYTLDVPNGTWHAPELFPGPPVIRNIRQNVYVFGAQAGYQTFGLNITSSVEVYNASGTLLKTVTGSPNGVAAPGDIAYDLEDDTSIPTTTPYQPPSSNFVGTYTPTTLFTLKHIVRVTSDNGYTIRPSSSYHVPTYKVDSFR